MMVGTGHGQRKLRMILTRAFVHGTMHSASKAFAGGTLPSSLVPAVGTVPGDLRFVARVFFTLQEERHRADYDLLRPLYRQEVNRVIADAKRTMQLWSNIRNHEATRLYLMSLLVWDRWKGR